MPLWGLTNVSSNSVKWQPLAGSNQVGSALFANVTPGAFTGEGFATHGLWPQNVAGTQAIRSGYGSGWNLVGLGVGPVVAVTVANDGLNFANLAVGQISNGGANALFQVTVNSVGHVQTVTLLNGGGGFSNGAVAHTVQPANGIFQANISAPGIGYSNGDVFVFSNGVIIAAATVGTNSVGAVTGLTFTSAGMGFTSVAGDVKVTLLTAGSTNTITIANTAVGRQGLGYTNGDIVTFSNGITNASATVTTNATGGITSVAFTNIGSGFDGVPGHVVVGYSNATGGTSSGGVSANIYPVTFGPSGATIVANSTSFKTGSGLFLNVTVGGRAGRVLSEMLVAAHMTGNSVPPRATSTLTANV